MGETKEKTYFPRKTATKERKKRGPGKKKKIANKRKERPNGGRAIKGQKFQSLKVPDPWGREKKKIKTGKKIKKWGPGTF